MKQRLLSFLLLLVILCLFVTGCNATDLGMDQGDDPKSDQLTPQNEQGGVLGFASVEGIPDYSGSPYVVLNENEPEFTEEEKTSTKSYETYSPLDSLGRCGVTHACIGKDLMPTEDRGSISSVTPSGWINKKYDTDLVDGGYLYNRAHLIGFQLTGENANKQNLITGTRYMNVEGMLPFENMVADYIKETGNHVMYRVTPIFVGQNLVASGVQMEAYSVEDQGDGICFNVFVYNVQPGIMINYLTGDNCLNEEAGDLPEDEAPVQGESPDPNEQNTYVLNKSSKRFHLPSCSSVSKIGDSNKEIYTGTRQSLVDQKYLPCGSCKP